MFLFICICIDKPNFLGVEVSGNPVTKAAFIIFMNKCAEMQIRIARAEDIPGLVPLVNSAYRGEGGWTNESHLIGGPRTGAAEVEETLYWDA